MNSFVRDGFLFDGGIREVENAGMVKPMLKELYPENTADVDTLASNIFDTKKHATRMSEK